MHIKEKLKHLPVFLSLLLFIIFSYWRVARKTWWSYNATQPDLIADYLLINKAIFPVNSGTSLKLLFLDLVWIFCSAQHSRWAIPINWSWQKMKLICRPAWLLHVCTWTYLMLCLISLMVPLGAELSICSEGCPSVWLSSLKVISHPTPDSLGLEPETREYTDCTRPYHQTPAGSVHMDISQGKMLQIKDETVGYCLK